jgi:hypothetical protein
MGLAQPPAVGDNAVSDGDAGIRGCLDGASQIDARDQGKLANDVRAPGNGERILVVHSRVVDRDGYVSRHEILLSRFDHAGRDLFACLCCEQRLERHRTILAEG